MYPRAHIIHMQTAATVTKNDMRFVSPALSAPFSRSACPNTQSTTAITANTMVPRASGQKSAIAAAAERGSEPRH